MRGAEQAVGAVSSATSCSACRPAHSVVRCVETAQRRVAAAAASATHTCPPQDEQKGTHLRSTPRPMSMSGSFARHRVAGGASAPSAPSPPLRAAPASWSCACRSAPAPQLDCRSQLMLMATGALCARLKVGRLLSSASGSRHASASPASAATQGCALYTAWRARAHTHIKLACARRLAAAIPWFGCSERRKMCDRGEAHAREQAAAHVHARAESCLHQRRCASCLAVPCRAA